MVKMNGYEENVGNRRWGVRNASSICVVKGLKPYGVVSGADGADNSPVIKASQERRTHH